MDWAKLLMIWLRVWICVYLMYDDAWIDPWHLLVGPSEYISKFFEERRKGLNLFFRARWAYMNVFDYPRFNRYIYRNGWRNDSQIPLWEDVKWGMKLARTSFSWWGGKRKTMVGEIPKGISWNHGFHDTFVWWKNVMEGVVWGLPFFIGDHADGLDGLVS